MKTSDQFDQLLKKVMDYAARKRLDASSGMKMDIGACQDPGQDQGAHHGCQHQHHAGSETAENYDGDHGWYQWGGEEINAFQKGKGKKGKGKGDQGKGKGDQQGKGKGGFQGSCYRCGQFGHSQRDCPLTASPGVC